MLQINVSQLLKSAIGTKKSYHLEDLEDTVDTNGSAQVMGEIDLMRTDRGILGKGTLTTDTKLTCSRCLSSFSCPVTLKIEDVFLPTVDISTGTPLSSPDEPGNFHIDEYNIINLSEAIRQYAITVIPMKPLCRADCAGLCPICGNNLNVKSCNCPPETPDPRWSELNKIAVNETKGTK